MDKIYDKPSAVNPEPGRPFGQHSHRSEVPGTRGNRAFGRFRPSRPDPAAPPRRLTKQTTGFFLPFRIFSHIDVRDEASL